jgi:gliding motility-associated-like protein
MSYVFVNKQEIKEAMQKECLTHSLRFLLSVLAFLFSTYLYPQSITFNNTSTGAFGTIQTWTVPLCVDSISIEVWGAQGGNGTAGLGGPGGRMKGDFSVIPGQVLKILVGQQGSSCDAEGGGGGGTYVTDTLNSPLIIAGGGGGSSIITVGAGGTTATCGVDGAGNSASPGGCAGNGGGSGQYNSSSGGGLLTDGLTASPSFYPCTTLTGGGKSFISGGNGGTGTCPTCSGGLTADGGFGGGGGSYGTGSIGGSGGGGYSGGGAGSNSSGTGGGGGGSYNGGANQSNNSGVRAGHGQVIITILSYSIPPTSLFTVSTPVCQDTNSIITYLGSGVPGDTYNWNFDGGIVVSGSGQGPYTVNWASAGIKNSTLTVNSNGCTSTLTTIPVTVIQPPTASFTVSAPVCPGSIATITYTGTAAANADYFWNFNGGTIIAGSGQGPYMVSWPAEGTYNISLTVTENGCSSPATNIQQIVLPPPNANFSSVNVCLNQTTNFIDLSTISSGSITAWEWSFGDGSTLDTAQTPGHTFTNQGNYSITLIVRSGNGCADTVSENAIVYPLPQAQFTTVNICDGTYAQFSNSSIILSPDVIQGWLWTFGDNVTANNQNTSHLYADTGTYTVELLTISNFGCKDSISKIIVVNPNPIVNFTGSPVAGCEALCTSFSDSTFLSSGNAIHWSWDFGDGSPTNNSPNFEHCFTTDSVFSPITFNISLTVTSDSGCISTVSKNNYITVYPNPTAGFTIQPNVVTISNPTIAVIDASSGANFWNWNFGDMDTTSLHSPTPHTYADTGTYTITLITSTLYGCSDTAYQTVVVEPDFIFYVPNSFTPNDDGINDTFTGQGIFIKEYEMSIYDRWGNLIFYSSDINKPWDGKANHGTDTAQRDVYIYTINATDFKNKKHNYKGIVTLVR